MALTNGGSGDNDILFPGGSYTLTMRLPESAPDFFRDLIVVFFRAMGAQVDNLSISGNLILVSFHV